MKKLKTNDQVIVLTGRSKGKVGSILSILSDGRLLVSGVNLVKKHTKPNPQKNIQGGILEKESPIDRSNVALVNPATGKASRVGFRISESGQKERYFKSTNDAVAP